MLKKLLNNNILKQKNKIPVFKPFIQESEIKAATLSLKEGWLGMGKYVEEFEHQIGKLCKIRDEYSVVAVSTGHAALHLSLQMLNLKKGDEVITPSFNNTADFQAIKACGANPVFVDIEEETLCIDVSKIESFITRCCWQTTVCSTCIFYLVFCIFNVKLMVTIIKFFC